MVEELKSKKNKNSATVGRKLLQNISGLTSHHVTLQHKMLYQSPL
jgi:hypothetical protein